MMGEKEKCLYGGKNRTKQNKIEQNSTELNKNWTEIWNVIVVIMGDALYA